MERKRARRWPYGVSRFLNKDLDFRPDIDSATYTLLPTDTVLCPSEEDTLERAQRKAKRRRIHRLSRACLGGEPLFILSASLKGPFERHGDQDQQYTEENNTVQQEQSAPAVYDLTIGQYDQGVDVITAVTPPAKESSGVNIDSTINNEEDEDLRKGMDAAKRLSLFALKAIDAQSMASPAESSPFIYRKGKLPGRRLVLEHAVPLRREIDLHDLSNMKPNRRRDLDHTFFPNARLSHLSRQSESPGSARRRLHADMEASGASFEQTQHQMFSMVDRSPLRTRAANSSPNRMDHSPEKLHKMHRGAPLGGAASADIPISTQAALREAHLDLLNDSPLKNLVSPDRRSVLSRSKDQSESPVPAVTPFATIHSRFNAAHLSTQENHVSTQIMLDGFSPFQISPMKPPNVNESLRNHVSQIQGRCPKGSQSNTQNSQRAIMDGWSFASLASAPEHDLNSPAKHRPGSHHSSHKPLSSKTKVINGSQSRSIPGLTKLGFKISKPQSTSNTADSKSSQGTKKASTHTDTGVNDRNRSVNRSHSFNLAEILEDLSSGSSGEDKIGKDVFKSPLCSPPKVFTPQSRGKVIDWDAASDRSGEAEVNKEENTDVSRVQDSFAPIAVAQAESVVEPVKSGGWVCVNPSTLSQFSPASRPLSGYESSAPVMTGRSSLKSALRKTQKSSEQDAQRQPGLEDDMDLDSSLNDLRRSVLGSWDVDTALRGDALGT